MENKNKPSLCVTLIQNLYERQTGYRPKDHAVYFDGNSIYVHGYVGDLPSGFQQVGHIKLYQTEPSGRMVEGCTTPTPEFIPATMFDVFPVAALTGVRASESFKLPYKPLQ